ncbi:MAG: LytR C-terminal domain-containing protein [Ilumatobacter sp.]|uniref:LytR C-terminal domain-containing protein n=1 Tax=Ilumatobacter sp. TaxID=1967498 RepID=UPI003C73D31B
MSNEESGLAASRRTPRQGVGGSPVGSWLTIALAVVAVVAGFLILRNINNDSSAALPDDTGTESDSSTPAAGDTLVPDVPETSVTSTTVAAVRTTEGASVVVANANTVGGSASGMTKTLDGAGYTMIEPVNASGPNLTASIVYFDATQAAAEAIANSIALDLGGVDVLEVDTPAPTDDGDLGGAGVLVMLGDDQAGKSLEELAPAGAEATDNGAAAPDPSDGEVPSTAPADADTGGDAETTEEDATVEE